MKIKTTEEGIKAIVDDGQQLNGEEHRSSQLSSTKVDGTRVVTSSSLDLAVDEVVECPSIDRSFVSPSTNGLSGASPTSSLVVDFDRSSPRLKEQYGQFRLSNKTSSALGHSRYFITEIGPGLFPSETHEVTISLQNNSRVIIESQSAAKVHIAPEESHASIGYRFNVAGGSSLIAHQAPTISYAGSKLISTIEINVETGSRAIVSELLAKVATTDQSIGSTFVDMMIDITYGGELVVIDRIATYQTPIHDEIAAKQVIGGGREVVGGIYVIGYHDTPLDVIDAIARDIAKLIPTVEVTSPTSPTPDVALIRARGDDPYAIEAFFMGVAKALSR